MTGSIDLILLSTDNKSNNLSSKSNLGSECTGVTNNKGSNKVRKDSAFTNFIKDGNV